MILNVLSPFVAEARKRASRIVIRAALAGVSALLIMVALGFATSALLTALKSQFGRVEAPLLVAAIYLAAAAILYVIRLFMRPKAATRVREAEKRAAAADLSQTEALAFGMDFVKQLTPLQLVLIGVLSGFLAGRKL